MVNKKRTYDSSNPDYLKAFQRATVDHVYRRLISESSTTDRFLVADEVGLGKTMVARGIISRMIDDAGKNGKRIDIIYICSSGAIISQNLDRLNVMARNTQIISTRLTLLATELTSGHGGGRVNYISFTPKTTFNIKNTMGTAKERALIQRLLLEFSPHSFPDNLDWVLKGRSGERGWKLAVEDIHTYPVDKQIGRNFVRKVKNRIRERISQLCSEFEQNQDGDKDMKIARRNLVGELRMLLATVSITSLKPMLIILDEFQRFHYLLRGDDSRSVLAKKLFAHTDRNGNRVKTLLLSATPYTMLTLSDENNDNGDHYQQFLQVLKFLFNDECPDNEGSCQLITMNLHKLRKGMIEFTQSFDGTTFESAKQLKDLIQNELLNVMTRTERVLATDDHDSMITHQCSDQHIEVAVRDLVEACSLERVAIAIGAKSTIRFWKSTPWALNFMRDYEFGKLMRNHSDSPSKKLVAAMKQAMKFQLNYTYIEGFRRINPPNALMRRLESLALDDGMARQLWISPSLPYFGTVTSVKPVSKILIFSEWLMVPNCIAGFLSYEAERRMGMSNIRKKCYRYKTYERLRITTSGTKLKGLRVLQLVIPSPILAEAADPLILASENGPFKDYTSLRLEVKRRLSGFVRKLCDMSNSNGSTVDPNWDWVSATSLDTACPDFVTWLEKYALDVVQKKKRKTGNFGVINIRKNETWNEHLKQLNNEATQLVINVKRDKLLSHLTDVALGSPATCALRSLSRIAPDLSLVDKDLLTAASRVGMAFRTLFNRPEAYAVLEPMKGSKSRKKLPHWQVVLSYVASHDLQSVLDEYVHLLSGATEHHNRADKGEQIKQVNFVAKEIVKALSIPSSQVDFDNYSLQHEGKRQINVDSCTLRGRFAMRLTGKSEDERGINRIELVRKAFNSPFHPFVLATTSVGQEGLDFHHYCHRVVHWSLPRNPVDMEQREGRVHRFKNHAVRLNVVYRHSAIAFKNKITNPWAKMFAEAERKSTHNGHLEPFWILPGKTKIERHILILPHSREVTRLPRLLQSLAIYRLAFGQPRQDDLLALLNKAYNNSPNKCIHNQLQELQICLQPYLLQHKLK